MKKVGVITFSKSINYGAFLQAYALQKTLVKIGVEPSLINYQNKTDKKRYRLINHESSKAIIKSFLLLPINALRKNSFRRYTKKLKYTPITEEYDIAITGSDQVWNPLLTGNELDEIFFLDGVRAKKKIAYAPSIANEKCVKKYENDYRRLVEKLDYISVREEKAKKELERIVKKDITVVADPTFLLAKKEWEEAISNIPINKDDYIFTYFVGETNETEEKCLDKICTKYNLKRITYFKKPEKNIYRYAFLDNPMRFLSRIRDSKLVLTSSFHGIALSILLHKNFYYFLPREDRRSRVDNILRIVGLTDRIIETEANLDKINLDDIDYTEPQKKLDALRKESLDWLKNAIEN